MKRLRRASRYLAHIPAVVWTTMVVLPFVFIVLLSFRSMADIYANPLSLTGAWVPENFSRAWEGPLGGVGFSRYFGNTLIVTIAAVTVSLTAGAIAAYFTSLLSQRWRRRVMMLFLIGTIIPAIALLIPLFRIFNGLNLLNEPLAVGVLYGGLSLPTSALILHSFFLEFPDELRDAAALDGLGPFASFTRIVLPLSAAPIAAAGILATVWVWGETQVGLVLLQSATSQTVPVGVLSFQGQFTSEQGPLFAGLTMAMLPLLVIYVVFSRHIRKGIALGGALR
ncbi:carbohydrate ABC transporter permease [Microbacterium sp. ET2]|uniref:carbohydrate ABC transporter permease n=1 Tax=Microbacterium albipurpureum TaxID=3050384 RepID=UPI00259CC774|nr:carbohydrate ABC transporter permease [Microbacterium sp. ET2 (Ac-2212)]WJL97025.1 carbohydrate ABC transporter permease [Microbacterium sp. ET2 (Ac-2212)]